MSIKSTSERYGTVARTLHWMSAVLILLLIPLGFVMQTAPEGLRLGLYRAHVVIGLLTGVLTLLRLIWWLALDRKPQASRDTVSLQHILAKAVHGAFYVALLVLAVSGIRMLVLSNLGTMLFIGDLTLAPVNLAGRPPRLVHGLMAYLLIALFVLHVLGALYHHWIERDGTLSKMGLAKARF
jgi:cytochrome b561